MLASPRVDNEYLIAAGMELMRCAGKPIQKIDSPGRSMIYRLDSGETVRMRTCNVHSLNLNVSDEGHFNIEGTDYLLFVTPEIERTLGTVIAYLVPTTIAIDAARQAHDEWFASRPNLTEKNSAPVLRFNKRGSPVANDFATKWSEFRLGTSSPAHSTNDARIVSTKEEVEAARLRIARSAGVNIDKVKVTIEYG